MTPLIIFKENFNFITAGIKYKDNTIDLIGILTTQLGNVSFSEIWSPIHNYMILQYDIILDYKTNCQLNIHLHFYFLFLANLAHLGWAHTFLGHFSLSL